MRRRVSSAAAASIVSLLFAGAALAAPGGGTANAKKYRAGVQAGFGSPTADDFGGSRALVGADFMIAHDAKIDFGASYVTGGRRLERTGRSWRTNFVGGELNLKLAATPPMHVYVGASAGLVSFDGGDAYLPGFDDLYFGPKAGFYRMITPELSWGIEGKLLFVTSSPFLAWVTALGNFRYHF